MAKNKVGEVEFIGGCSIESDGSAKGLCGLHGVTMRYSVQPQMQGEYALRGTVSIIDPATGTVMQVKGGAKRRILDQREAKRGGCEGGSSESSLTSEEKAIKRRETKVCMRRDIYVRTAEKVDIQQTIAEACAALYQKFCVDIKGGLRQNILVDEAEFPLLVQLFGEEFIAKKTSSAEMQKTYLNRLNRVAKFLPLSSTSCTDGHRRKLKDALGTTWEKYFLTASQFMEYLCDNKPCNHPINPFATNDLNVGRPKELSGKILPNILSEQEERLFNNRILDQIENGSYVGLALIKDGGYDSKTACLFYWKDADFGHSDQELVFIRYRRDSTSGSTHNYATPLFRFGSQVLKKRYDYLLSKFPPEKLLNMPIVSQPHHPEKPLEPSALTALCRTELLQIGMEYSALSQLSKQDTRREGVGISLFLKTYEYKLRECSYLDEAAINFMRHQIMKSVQADYYRSFTDTTAHDYLTTALFRCHRGEEVHHRKQRECVIREQEEDMELIMIYPRSDLDVASAILTLNTNHDPTIDIDCDGGCRYHMSRLEVE